MKLEGLLSALPPTASPADRELIQRAYRVAEKAHRQQRRVSGEPHIQHCLAVAMIMVELGAPAAVVAARPAA